jgi:hypothetical protein
MSTDMIFVMGTSRSGTTMMGRIFGKNESVFTFEEIHFFERIWSPGNTQQNYTQAEAVVVFTKLISNQRDGYLREKHPEKYKAEAEQAIQQYVSNHGNNALFAPNIFAYFLKYESNLNNKSIGCDQTPLNLLFASDIFSYFPTAKAIIMVRDPRDVLLSQKGKWKRKFLGAGKNIPWKETIRAYLNYHPYTISKLWNSSNHKVQKLINHPQVMVVKFEDLIEDPSTLLKKACIFLGITYNEQMLSVPQVGSSTGSDNPKALGINKSNKNKFLKGLNHAEIRICESVTKPLRAIYGYADSEVSQNYILLFWYILSFPVKLFLAFLFNVGRIKNLRQSIKRRL